ncbi:MAG: hypothetical protein IKW30_09985 [Lachnospiraceae bacterium]|nr:hypothetical protein [Lachnospiraceae bacterium]
MKKNLLHFLGIIITLTIIIIGIIKLGYWLRPIDTDGAYEQVETFHSLPQNSVEVIAYGSSYVLRGLNTMEMYKQYGIGAYNYAWHWQHINTTRTFMEDSFLTQKPKLALIETSHAGYVLEDTNMVGEIYYTRYLKNKKAVFYYLKQCFKRDIGRYLSYIIPLSAFHDNWEWLEQQNFEVLAKDGSYLKNMGFVPTEASVPITLSDPNQHEQYELENNAIEELDKIVALCKKNNVEILFYTVPYANGYYWNDAMEKYAYKNGCAYLNLFKYIEEIGIDSEKDYFDSGHFNTSGATKVANFLGNYIRENYDLTDMRTIEGNVWQQNLK